MKKLVALTLVLGLVLCLGCTKETKKPGTKGPAPAAGQKEAGTKAPAATEKAAKPEGGPAKEEKAPAKEEKAGEPAKPAKTDTPPPAKAGEEKGE